MNKKQKFSIGFMLASMVFILTFGAYSFFTTPGENNKNMELGLTSGEMALTFADGDNGINKQLEFGETVTKIFTIENTGTVSSSLSIDWNELINTYQAGSLSFKLNYSEVENGEKKEIIPKTNVPTSNIAITHNLASELSVPAGETYYYYLDITLNNTDFDQTNDIKASFSTNFKVGLPTKYRYYKLSINPNGGTWNTFTDTQEYQLQNNETFNIPNPTKEGYTFTGWNIEGTSSSISNDTFTMGISDTVLTATYSVNKYSISINIDGNTQTEEVEYGSTINLPDNPTKEGYTFTNYTVTGGILNGNTLVVTEPKDISVTANFAINNYKYIVYHNKQNIDGVGYTRIEADTDEGEAEYNSEITPGTKSYTGFSVPSAQNLTIKVETTYPPLLNKIEYNYQRNKHTLTLNLNGGTSTSTGGEMYFEATKDLGIPVKTGYNFTNWTVTSGTMTNNTFKMGDDNAVATANYTPKTFSVTFNANGGSPATQSKVVTYDSTYGDLPTPTYSGYDLVGWFTEAEGGTQITSSSDVKLSENQTLYAHWKKPTLIVTLNANGGYFDSTDVTTKTIEVTIGETYGELPKPTRYCNGFSGWRTAASGGTTITSDTVVTETSSTILYAYWWSICFTANTLIYTPNGYKMIQDIQAGDQVYSYNEETGEIEIDEVKETYINHVDSILEVNLEDGTIMNMTENHVVYDPIKKEWKSIRDFNPGDYLYKSNGELVKIQNINLKNESHTVYNFMAKKNHTYFVTESNILVHNACAEC